MATARRFIDTDGIGEPPCEGCSHAPLCSRGFACAVFEAWVLTGKAPAGQREPSEEIYRELFEAEVSPRRSGLEIREEDWVLARQKATA